MHPGTWKTWNTIWQDLPKCSWNKLYNLSQVADECVAGGPSGIETVAVHHVLLWCTVTPSECVCSQSFCPLLRGNKVFKIWILESRSLCLRVKQRVSKRSRAEREFTAINESHNHLKMWSVQMLIDYFFQLSGIITFTATQMFYSVATK